MSQPPITAAASGLHMVPMPKGCGSSCTERCTSEHRLVTNLTSEHRLLLSHVMTGVLNMASKHYSYCQRIKPAELTKRLFIL